MPEFEGGGVHRRTNDNFGRCRTEVYRPSAGERLTQQAGTSTQRNSEKPGLPAPKATGLMSRERSWPEDNLVRGGSNRSGR
jgi:hypothetical protein